MTEAVETKNENVETDVPVASPVEVVAVVEVVETRPLLGPSAAALQGVHQSPQVVLVLLP